MSAALNTLLAFLLLGGLAPAQAGTAPKPRATVKPKAPAKRLPNINTAPKAELARIPGLSEALAAQIVAHRPYLTKEHLVLKGVLPQPLYLTIRDRIACIPPKNWEKTVHSSAAPRKPKK